MIGMALLQIPLGLIYGNAVEWFVHRYLLHGLGRNKTSFWSFHWHDHHRNARRSDMVDSDYAKPLELDSPPGKELAALIAACLAHAPLLLVAPFFTLTVWYCAFNYYRVHKKSHRDPEWAREHLPWHVDHHMGPDQDQNWCVTKPWFDILIGTRVKYVGTILEERNMEKKRRLSDRRAATGQVSHESAS
jgi:sterol desaturase/sphingolipid hydroxylase (fatty acid hydroxylase superfamily)